MLDADSFFVGTIVEKTAGTRIYFLLRSLASHWTEPRESFIIKCDDILDAYDRVLRRLPTIDIIDVESFKTYIDFIKNRECSNAESSRTTQ